jgi:hypothetical protein
MLLLADELSEANGRDAPVQRQVCALGSNRLLREEGRCVNGFRRSEGRIVLTLDKDFWQIAVQRRVPLEQSCAILFRACLCRSRKVGPDTAASSPQTEFRCWLLEEDDPVAKHLEVDSVRQHIVGQMNIV